MIRNTWVAVVALMVVACGGGDAADDADGADGVDAVDGVDGADGVAGDGGMDGTGPGVCLESAAACDPTDPGACCSGRCEPVQGMSGVTQCAAVCRGDGASCDAAIECCGLDCNNGTCGGEICRVQSEDCSENAECCSNICSGGECQLDPANTECRGLGETCNSGSQQGCCSMVCDREQDPPRCAFGSDTCAGPNGACEVDGDCCRGMCDPGSGVCVTPCTATSGACTMDADCCSGTCTGGTCAPPVGCAPVGTTCTTGADCCTESCFAGFCDVIVP